MSRADKMQGNDNAKKPDEEKITGKGRIVIDLGDLKGEAVRASRAREMKLAPWIREAIEEKIPDADSSGMKLKRDVSQEQFEELCRATGETYSGLVKQWRAGVEVFLIQSAEYRSICRSGRACRDLAVRLIGEARDRGYSQEQVEEMFGDASDPGCSFN